MLEYLKGNLQEILIEENKIIIDVSGIGYEVRVPKSSILKLEKNQATAKFYVWESSGGPYSGVITLYGFLTRNEREVFLKLRNIKGIGSQDAISILDKIGSNFDEFLNAVNSQNLKTLQNLFGFKGKKAEKIISGFKYTKISEKLITTEDNSKQKIIDDVFSALVNMGFREFEIREALQALSEEIKNENMNFNNLFKEILKRLKK